jgi:D-3-phosphoglycerate dehydrogenase
MDRLAERAEVRLFKDRVSDVEEQVGRAQGAVAIINSRSYVKWPEPVLARLPELRFITVAGIGADAIDLAAARKRGIAVSNLPGRTAPVVAEHAFGLMLAVAKRAAWYTDQLRQGRWVKKDLLLLQGKTVGVIGAGPIAQRFASLCRGIGMKVIGWTFHPSAERARQIGIDFVPLDELLQRSDVISLHLPLTDQSRRLIGRRELSMVKAGCVLINCGRGALVDEAALVEALNSGRLMGAGLDVYEQEPLPAGSAIAKCEQVILTPHVADMTPEGLELLNEGVVENVLAFLDGKPQNVVN